MNKEQKLAVQYALLGFNVFITGSAGTGKSYTLRNIINNLPYAKVTGTTGIGASLIGGQTIHSLLRVGLANLTAEKYAEKRAVIKQVLAISCLIIDEISMMNAELFDKIEKIFRLIKKSEKPFGGIQLIISGDFLQLPPVHGLYAFQSSAWNTVNFKVVHLTKVIRQDNALFSTYLNMIRKGNITNEIVDFFNDRKYSKYKAEIENMDIKPIYLTTHRDRAAKINDSNLAMLKTQQKESKTYKLTTEVRRSNVPIKPHVDDEVELVVGAQVVLICNLDPKMNLVNGTKGIIRGFAGSKPIVEFPSCTDIVSRYTWSVYDKSDLLYSYNQIPLIPGYAITVHKSQGMTLDSALVDLRNSFDCGHIYVSLSRVRSADKLYIVSIDWGKVMVSDCCLEYYSNIDDVLPDTGRGQESDEKRDCLGIQKACDEAPS